MWLPFAFDQITFFSIKVKSKTFRICFDNFLHPQDSQHFLMFNLSFEAIPGQIVFWT